MRREVLLGLGTNRGDRIGYLRRALRALDGRDLRLQTVSSVYESDAMLPEGAPDDWNDSFLNLAVRASTTLGPRELLERVKEVERSLGRRASARWAPREIDVDILAMEGVALDETDLKIPHVGLRERPFALLPAAELAPDWRLSEGSAPLDELARPWSGAALEEVPFRTGRSSFSLTQLQAILNVTQDSFSDGGALGVPGGDPGAALARARELIAAGAAVLDVGAESTRPGATPVDPETEWRRLAPLLEALAAERRPGAYTLSVDTRHGSVARRALALGADWINDVEGATDPELRRAVADAGATLVLMHNLGVPPRADRVLPPARDPVAEVREWALAKLSALAGEGIPRERIILDPGLGFGKTPAQNLAIVASLGGLRELGLPLLVGHSRKGFLVERGGAAAPDRDVETLVVTLALVERGADYLRVHDLPAHRRALRARARLGAPIRWR